MDEFKVFPPSLNLSSGMYYICGVDVCEEGLQFCNVIDRRCEYCADYHYDCFTYTQQQNCTQYCQDQWLLNQLEFSKNQSIISGNNISHCQDLCTILSIVLGICLFSLFISLVFHVPCIKKRFWNLMKSLFPDKRVRFCEKVVRERKNPTNERKKQPRYSNGSGIEDLDAMEGMQNGNDISGQGPQNEPNTGRKSIIAQVNNHSESHETIHSNITASENDANNKRNVDHRANLYLHNSSGDCLQEEKKTNGLMQSNFKVDTKFGTEKSEQGFKRFNYPVPRFEVSKGQSKAIPPKSYDSTEGNGSQTYIPHGELSTMSSHGDYQAMLPSHCHSSDNGYVTLKKQFKDVTSS